MNRIAFIFILSLLVISCRKDNLEMEMDFDNPNLELVYESLLYGMVSDIEGTEITDVKVSFANEVQSTDENGFFSVNNAELNKDGSLIKFEKAGYFTAYKFANSIENEPSYLSVKLVEKNVVGTLSSSSGGSIALNDNATINFPADAISYPDGSAYNGVVNVSAHYYAPNDPLILQTMPGDLRGKNLQNQEVQLGTYGMMAVELTDENQAELQIASGKTVELNFPLDNELSSNAPETIPTWSLDETSGIWKEEGIASLTNDSYITEVSHFSFWNCDAQFPVVEITGRILNERGEGVPNQLVRIKLSNIIGGYGYTNAQGYFKGKVPQGAELELSVQLCDFQETKTLSPMNADTDVGDLTFNTLDYEVEIKGTFTDCFNQGLKNAYSITKSNRERVVSLLDQDGNLDTKVYGCGSELVKLKVYHRTSLMSTDEISIDPADSPVDLNTVKLCDTDSEFFSFNFDNGETHFLSDLTVYKINGNELLLGGYDDISQDRARLLGTIIDQDNMEFIGIFLSGNNQITNENIYGYCDISSSCLMSSEFSETQQGTDISWVGKMEVGLETDTIGNGTVMSDVNYQLTVDKEFNEGTIKGKVWYDINMDGIKDSNEPGLEGFRLDVRTQDLVDNNLYDYQQFSVTSDENGEYEFDKVFPDITYEITVYSIQQGYNLSPSNVGSEDTDNDFVDANGNFYSEFTVGDGETLNNHDLGIHSKPLNVYGFGRSGCKPEIEVNINVANGLPPFDYQLNNGQSSTDGTFIISEGGNYVVTVNDALNNSDSYTFNLDDYANSVSCRPFIDSGTGTIGKYDITDEFIEDLYIELLDAQDNFVRVVTYNSIAKSYRITDVIPGDYKIKVTVPANLELLELGDPNDFGTNDVNPDSAISRVKLLECSNSASFFIAFK